MLPILIGLGGLALLAAGCSGAKARPAPDPKPAEPRRSPPCPPEAPKPRPAPENLAEKWRLLCGESAGRPLPTLRLFQSGKKTLPQFWESPWEADLASRMSPMPESRERLQETRTLRLQAESPRHGAYELRWELPANLLSEAESSELLRTFLELNDYPTQPISLVTWNSQAPEYCAENSRSAFCQEAHSLVLNQEDRFPGRLPGLVHEMGHAVHHTRFKNSEEWDRVFQLSLGFRNYEILDDSNYIPCSPDLPGHPFSNAAESFASAFLAYYLAADTMSAYLRHSEVPESMRRLGLLAWTFMRDRVFSGKLFTSDGKDPFADLDFPGLLDSSRAESHESAGLCSALQDPDPAVQVSASGRLFAQLPRGDALSLWMLLGFESSDPETRARTEADLDRHLRDLEILQPALAQALELKDVRIRRRAIRALPATAPWREAFQRATRDPDPEVRRIAERKLR